MSVSNNLFNKVTSFISGKEDQPSKLKEKGKATFAKELNKLDFVKAARFLNEDSLKVSLRGFTKQMSDCTKDILSSSLSNEGKISALKTYIGLLQGAIEGRRALISNPSLKQRAEFLFLHGKTLQSLDKKIEDAEAQIKTWKNQLAALEGRQKTVGKPLPTVPQQTIPDHEKFDAAKFMDYLFRPQYREQMRSLVPIMGAVFGIEKGFKELHKEIQKELGKAPSKDLAVKNHISLVADILTTIPPGEFEKEENLNAFLHLAAELYQHPKASMNNKLVMECNKHFGMDQFQRMLESRKGDPGFNQAGLSKLQEHAKSTPIPSSVRSPQRIEDLNTKLIEIANETSKTNYQKMIKVIGRAIYEDAIEGFKKVGEYDVFDTSKTKSNESFSVIEDKIRLFILDPNISLKERSKRAGVILELAKYNYDHKNYQAVNSLVNIIYSLPTLDSIPLASRHEKIKETLTKMVNLKSNFAEYRKQIEKDGDNCVPALPVALSDLYAMGEGTKGAKSMANLQNYARLRREYFQARDRVKAIPRESPYTFLNPQGKEEVFTQTRNLALQAGYPDVEQKNLEEIQSFLRRKVKDQLVDAKVKIKQ